MLSESSIKRQKSMVPISMAGLKKNWLNSVRVLSNIKFAMQDGWPTGLPNRQTQLIT